MIWFLKSPFGRILKYLSRFISLFIPNRKLRHKVRNFFDFNGPQNLKYYFSKKYIPLLKNMKTEKEVVSNEYVFQCWLQGEDNAPPLVQKCFESVKRFTKGKKRVVITNDNLNDWVKLPSYIIQKYEKGIIGNAHFADILRLCLLSKYGGYWVDATCLMTSEFPEWLEKEDFFMFHTDDRYRYTLIQNCFIKSNPNNYLIDAWKFLMFEYWKNENKTLHYFFGHLLFSSMVFNSDYAKNEFEKMPYVLQNDTHVFLSNFYNKFDMDNFSKIISNSFIHKLDWKFESKKKYGKISDSYINFFLSNDLDYILKCSPK